MTTHEIEREHRSALSNAEKDITGDVREGFKHGASGPDYHNIYSELSSLSKDDSRLFGDKGSDQFKKDLSNIDSYLKSHHLPALNVDQKTFESKMLNATTEANKNHDFSNVFGYLDARKAADEGKYGKELGDLLFNGDLSDTNSYLQKHNLPQLTIEDKGNGNFGVEQNAVQGGAAQELSNSTDTATALRKQSETVGHEEHHDVFRGANHHGDQGERHHGGHHAGHHGGHHGGHRAARRAESALSHYIEGGGQGAEQNPPGSGAGLDGGQVAQSNQIMNTLINKYGFSPAGAAGVVGNMTQENGLSTEVNSGGVGLCQWIGPRAKEEARFAKSMGASPTSVEAQVGFMVHELKRDYPALLHQLQNTNDAQKAALAFSQQYERPGKPQNGNRKSFAQSALNQYESSGGDTRQV